MQPLVFQYLAENGLLDEALRYEHKRDYILRTERRDILREQLMQSLADFYRLRRRNMYRGMRNMMEKTQESCIDIPKMWPYVRHLLDELVLLARTSKYSEREFNLRLQDFLRDIVYMYDHVVPTIDACRKSYTRDLFFQ